MKELSVFVFVSPETLQGAGLARDWSLRLAYRQLVIYCATVKYPGGDLENVQMWPPSQRNKE